MWGSAAGRWYREQGRHALPWRLTRDPWPILLSEVMLQQTAVPRVLARWPQLAQRWPSAADLASTPLDELLRAWSGLGYPRRAVALRRTAALVSVGGWPPTEAGLRSLPGVGSYTARALRVLAFDDPGPPPRDVNAARIAARHRLGVEPHLAAPAAVDEALRGWAPAGLDGRERTYALFDVGALHCRARPRCCGCPVARSCASRRRLGTGDPPPAPRRQAAWRGSQRQLRGSVLRELLALRPPRSIDELRRRVGDAPAAARSGAVESALGGLRDDGLIGARRLAGEARRGPVA